MMMTFSVFALIVVGVGIILFLCRLPGGGANQQAKRRRKAGKVLEMEKDPVCGMMVSQSSLSAEYQKRRYYFCSGHCQQVFTESPGYFL